jgi:hypothetical protein
MLMETSCDRKPEPDSENYTDRQFVLSSNISKYSGVGNQAGE